MALDVYTVHCMCVSTGTHVRLIEMFSALKQLYN